MEIDHVTAIVEDLDACARAFEILLGRGPDARVELPGMRVDTYRIGAFELHLNMPTADGPVREHLERHGPSFHHVALRTADLDASLATLAAEGLPARGEPVETAHGLREVFLEPGHLGRLFVQLVERRDDGVAREMNAEGVARLVSGARSGNGR